jgi:hypothetical protein
MMKPLGYRDECEALVVNILVHLTFVGFCDSFSATKTGPSEVVGRPSCNLSYPQLKSHTCCAPAITAPRLVLEYKRHPHFSSVTNIILSST